MPDFALESGPRDVKLDIEKFATAKKVLVQFGDTLLDDGRKIDLRSLAIEKMNAGDPVSARYDHQIADRGIVKAYPVHYTNR